MEIKYDQFNKWTTAAKDLNSTFDPFVVADLQKYDKLLYVFAGRLSKEHADAIDDYNWRLRETLPLLTIFSDVAREINLNTANIHTQDQLDRYLTYLKKELRLTIIFLSMTLQYEKIIEHRDDLIPEWDPNDLDVITDTPVRISAKPEYAAPNYIERCVNTVNTFKELSEYIDRLLFPDQPLKLNNELEANTHRLLLLHELGLFEPLFKAHYKTLSAVRFSKLIATLIGVPKGSHEGFRPSVSELINSINKKQHTDNGIKTAAAVNRVNAFLSEIGIINKA